MSSNRLRVNGYVVSCPNCLDNPETCQLAKIRKLPLKERFQWVASLAENEIDAIVSGHNQCHIKVELDKPNSAL